MRKKVGTPLYTLSINTVSLTERKREVGHGERGVETQKTGGICTHLHAEGKNVKAWEMLKMQEREDRGWVRVPDVQTSM